MGLKADIDEVKDAWLKSPWWFKGWLCLSAFCSVSAIASLSENVVKWKGFFLDAVVFYHSFISVPLRTFLAPLGYHLTPSGTDFIVIALFLCGIFSRSVASVPPTTKRRSPSASIGYAILFLAFMIFALFTLEFWNNKTISTTQVIFNSLLMLLGLGLVLRWDDDTQRGRDRVKLYYAQVIFCMIAFGIIAAINKGIYG